MFGPALCRMEECCISMKNVHFMHTLINSDLQVRKNAEAVITNPGRSISCKMLVKTCTSHFATVWCQVFKRSLREHFCLLYFVTCYTVMEQQKRSGLHWDDSVRWCSWEEHHGREGAGACVTEFRWLQVTAGKWLNLIWEAVGNQVG